MKNRIRSFGIICLLHITSNKKSNQFRFLLRFCPKICGRLRIFDNIQFQKIFCMGIDTLGMAQLLYIYIAMSPWKLSFCETRSIKFDNFWLLYVKNKEIIVIDLFWEYDLWSFYKLGKIIDFFFYIFSGDHLEGNDQIPQITSLAFRDGLNLGVGTSTGHILLYDIRSSRPMLIKDHFYGIPIKKLLFHSTLDQVISLDAKSVKVSRMNQIFINYVQYLVWRKLKLRNGNKNMLWYQNGKVI